jgi:hypothetical protein
MGDHILKIIICIASLLLATSAHAQRYQIRVIEVIGAQTNIVETPLFKAQLSATLAEAAQTNYPSVKNRLAIRKALVEFVRDFSQKHEDAKANATFQAAISAATQQFEQRPILTTDE